MASQINRPRRSSRVSNQQSIQDQPRAKWTLYLTKTLADLMAEQVYRGNRQNNSFGKKAWEQMCLEFQRKTDLIWDKEQLKNRYSVMRKQYATVKALLDLNGFSWDGSLSMVKAKDELWNEHIKAHPDAEAIRSNGCPYYKQLCIIFGESSYSEKYEQLSVPMIIDEEGVFIESPNTVGMPIDFGAAPSMFVKDETYSSTDEGDGKRQYRRGGRDSNRSSDMEDIMVRAILETSAASKLRTAAVVQSRERYSITKCIGALDEMVEGEEEGVDGGVYYGALDLFDNPNARETFMSLKVEKRLGWLKGKCKCNSNAPFSSSS